MALPGLLQGHNSARLIYLKTEAGQLAFKQRSPELSQKQRSAFLQFDGQRTLADVLQAVHAIGISMADIEDLINKAFLAAASIATKPSEHTPALLTLNGDEKQLCYQKAYPIAVSLCSTLGLRGFTLTLAVEAASGYDDLLALLPKLDAALPAGSTRDLKRALGMG